MKLTLLDYVQTILSSLDSDEVNSISDTPEALQVANVVKQTYFNIIARSDLPEHTQLIQLDPSLDITEPVVMKVPAGIGKFQWVKYFNSNVFDTSTTTTAHGLNTDLQNTQGLSIPPPGYQYVNIVPVQQFIEITNSFNPKESNVASFVFNDSNNDFPGTFTFYYKNNRQPCYCTILSDHYVIFDSYDNTQDSTLQASKTMAFGEIIPHWQMVDTFVPNIDESTVPLLLNESKSLAFFELKQTPHSKAEQEAKRAWSSVQRDKSLINRPTYFDQLPNFGRWGRSSFAGLSFFKLRGWDRP